MEVVNVNALPMLALDERLVVSVNARTVLENALRKQLQDNPPSILPTLSPASPVSPLDIPRSFPLACIIGSMSQVNQKITEIELGSSLVISTSAIEDYEVKKPKKESPISCQGSELRNARVVLTKRKTADKNLLAELHEHPPFDEMKPNKLPNGVDFCDMVGNVIRSEKNPLSGKSYCSDRELEKFLCSPYLAAIWLDSFWWLFHERYQPDREIQKKLFDRISRNYASLLFKMRRSHYEEALLKRLSSLLSKAVYTSFCCCFPQSWFNTHEFKTEICNTMDLWISGTYPCPQSYNNWDYSELDPERFRREELMLQSSRLIKAQGFSVWPWLSWNTFCKLGWPRTEKSACLCLPSAGIKAREFTLFTCQRSSTQKMEQKKNRKFRSLMALLKASRSQLINEKSLPSKETAEERWKCRSHREQSHPACKSPELISNQFNLYGKSPLMVYFFLNYSQLQLPGRDLLVSRREKTEVIPHELSIIPFLVLPAQESGTIECDVHDRAECTDSTMTYADIIQLVTKNMEIRRKKLRQLDQMHENEWNCFNNYLMELQENFERELDIINKKEQEKRRPSTRSSPPRRCSITCLTRNPRETRTEKLPFFQEKEKKEKRKVIYSPFSPRSTVDNYSLGLRSPYRIKSPSSGRSSSKSRGKLDTLFRLSPTSME
ncbi:Family with sequence similarity 227, member A [Apodemus speciosus]|uniref:Family with sequence similarity 227, member A n=1 Tax=Apodemus speciosus TaxID=105296 RepID=A0ABQ0FK04_APOSI